MRLAFLWYNYTMKGRKRKQGRFCASEGISQGCKPSPGTRSDWSTFKAAHDTDNGHNNEGAISAPFFLSLRRYERPCESVFAPGILNQMKHSDAQRATW